MPRIMALDYGRARVGVALSDEDALIAQPLTALPVRGPKQALRDVVALVKQWQPAEVLLGVPLDANGGDGTMALEVRTWGEALATAIAPPLTLIDERYSSQWAQRALSTMPRAGRGTRSAAKGKPSTRQSAKGRIDMLAAQALLEDYLRARRHPAP